MRTPNQNLIESFPELKTAFHDLKTHNEHFQKLLKRYEELEAIIHKVDHGQEAMSDLALEQVKKERVVLKDELYLLLNKHSHTTTLNK